MIDNKKFADILTDYSLDIKENDLVVIKIENEISQPLVKELYKNILLKNAHPVVVFDPAFLREDLFSYSTAEQLNYVSKMSVAEYQNADKIIFINSPENTNFLSGVDKDKLALRTKALNVLTQTLIERSSAGDLDWVMTAYPTNAVAQNMNMSLNSYCDLFTKISFLNSENPVEEWLNVYNKQQFLIDKLSSAQTFRIKGEDTDLTLSVKGRTWQNCAGQSNFPDGEICISPVEDSVNGKIYFDFPSYFRGQCVEKIRLKFKNGKVVKASAEKNEEFLNKMLNIDNGAKFLGEFAFGLNNNIVYPSGNILFDEKIGGSIHVALGNGGMNKSSIHWDIVKNMKGRSEIFADKKLIYKNGEFCF